MSDHLSIFEVGPRDGLQNESRPISFNDRLWFIRNLSAAGFKDMEIGAFVRPDRVPQMKNTEEIISRTKQSSQTRYWALVPNQIGLERAIETGIKNIAFFTAVTEGFNQANIGMSVKESLAEWNRMIPLARKHRLKIRGYLSTAFGCPYDGEVPAKKTLRVIEKIARLGVDEISVGDTIGVAVPQGRGGIQEVIGPALKNWGPGKIAVHFHDTRGTALANTLRALDLGARIIDASAGGLGGCPFAPGATGNLATEDVVYMVERMGFKTGIDLRKLANTSLELARRMKRPLTSRFLMAYSKSKE